MTRSRAALRRCSPRWCSPAARSTPRRAAARGARAVQGSATAAGPRAAPAEAQPRGEWWKAFDDPVLDELVARADRNNTSIQVAAARLAQARALARSRPMPTACRRSASAPARARGAASSDGTAGPARDARSRAGANLVLRARPLRQARAGERCRALDAQSREALLQSTRLLVQAEVAQTYLALRALDAERALVREHGRGLPRHAAT